jgi:hypothetical protein
MLPVFIARHAFRARSLCSRSSSPSTTRPPVGLDHRARVDVADDVVRVGRVSPVQRHGPAGTLQIDELPLHLQGKRGR